MTCEHILFELAILNSWQQQFPTEDEQILLAQKLHRERLRGLLLSLCSRN